MEGAAPGPNDVEKRQQQEAARRSMLDQILTPEARERLSRISLVKPEKGRSLEDWLINGMQTGRIRNRLTEPDLLNILDQIDAQEQKQRSSKVVLLKSVAHVGSDIKARDLAKSCIDEVKRSFDAFDSKDSIPSLNSSPLPELTGKIVKFCGLIVSESQEDEFILPLRLNKNGNWTNLALFREPGLIEEDEETDGVSLGFDHASLMARKSVSVVSPPGLNEWASHGQSFEEPVDVIVYGEDDLKSVRLGKAFEFYGVLHVDLESKGLSLHLLGLKEMGKMHGYAGFCLGQRAALLEYLSSFFASNKPASLAFLLHLVSSITERKNGLMNSLLIGHFPINLIVEEQSSADAIVRLISRLCPASYKLAFNASSLDAVSLLPKLDSSTSNLIQGLLQLAPGTQLILDETELSECQFSEKATKNLKALVELLEHQMVGVEMGEFQEDVKINTDVPVLSISTHGKSILHKHFSLSFKVKLVSDAPLNESELDAWREYLCQARNLAVSIPADIATRLEAEYVARRKDHSLDENLFGQLINLAKLVSKSHLAPEMTLEHWEVALAFIPLLNS